MKRQGKQHDHKDPVCGMAVSYTTAVEEFVYQGKAYYFCSTACREAFQAEPERYLPHHRQHGMKPG
ncbi:50S ribosomal protein L24 [Salinisphaera sp. PC39]|uniref:YHS domain-containing protein n=1 Tax=Salinisphaera sp. PC39 TaxID=1304156 RepID=UPI003340EDF7